jgi:hypothetical protein
MSPENTKVAIAYDFDGTLAPGYMQHNSFIPKIGMDSNVFWEKAKTKAKENDMDEILAYMHLMIEEARYHHMSIKKQSIIDHGKDIKFFNGVKDWFSRINEYALGNNIEIEHYIISSGLREMIEGCKIGSEFQYIFASGFEYDQDEVATWPALCVNYTTKTQYLFRINKGVNNSWDNEKVNEFVPDENRPIPFNNMIYIGDGETDVPSMKMLMYQGGTSIAVWDPEKKKKKQLALELLDHRRTNLAVPADYREGNELDIAIRSVIDQIAARVQFYKQQNN